MDKKKEPYVFETPIKPELEYIKKIELNCEDFSNSEKAEALIRSLNLSVNDTIIEDSEENYTINSKMVLEGDEPRKYKWSIEAVKKILNNKEILGISKYMNLKKENEKKRDKLYYSITKRVEKLYDWDDVNKTHLMKAKKNKVIGENLDYLSNNNCGFCNMIYHLLSKEDSDYVYCYKCAWNNKPIPNIQKWQERNDGKYRVLTDSEADSACEDYLDDDYMWKCAVEAGNTTSGLEDWKQDVINMDGRGSLLNGYDGCEESETINGTDYYIYRTN